MESENKELETEVEQTGKKKGKLIAGLTALAVLAGVGGAYAYKAQSYKDHFNPGTVINGIDVTGMTVDEALQSVKAQAEGLSISMTFPGGSTEKITGADMALTYVPDGSLERLMGEQNPYLWGGSLVGYHKEHTVTNACAYDAATLQQAIEALPEFQPENYEVSTDAKMVLGKDLQFTIEKETYGTQLNLEVVMEKLGDVIEQREETVSFDSSFYVVPLVRDVDETLNADVEENNKVLRSKIVLTLHDEETTYEIGPKDLVGWLAVKEDNPDYYYVDQDLLKEKATEAAAALAEEEDFTSDTYTLATTNRGDYRFHSAEFGCEIDQEAEAAQILADVLSGETVERTPNYSKEYEDPKGDTWVEVDIANQMVYMYKEGELLVASSCVSGTDTIPDRRSDRGFFHVTRRNSNYTMRGAVDPETGKPEYESFVNYAVFYNGGEALHDASWRYSFGGNTYKYSGSHGCINLPYNAAQTIFRNSYVGMPVFVF